MSCYESEEGTIKIPSKEWAKFRTAVIKAWNEHQLQRLAKAQALHKRLKETLKGKRGSVRTEALREALARHSRQDPEGDIQCLVIEGWRNEPKLRSVAPKKKDFQILPTSKDASIYLGDASIHLKNKTKCVVWVVPENNHAREHARKHPVAKTLFRLLDRITWTRGSGGQIVGNDEYNRDAGHGEVGGGGNYVTAEYGPNVRRPRRTGFGNGAGSTFGWHQRHW